VNYASGATVCRPAADACDVAETCDGAGSCPADLFAGLGTACGDASSTTCTAPDSCDGSGACLPNNTADGISCGGALTQYQCGGGTGCAAKPQTRVVSQLCSGGLCAADTGVAWSDLDVCATDEICLSSTGAAWCDLCDAFPANYCSGGDAYQYGSAYGACATGSCSYTPTFVDCPYGCTGGACNPYSDTIIEDFETGTWPWSPWVSVSGGGTVGTAYAHDGSRGITNPDWYYRTDTAFGTTVGSVLSAWIRAASGGRAYFGFCASSAGAYSIVVAPNTTQFMFQNNSAWGYTDVATATQSYTASTWYKVEVEVTGAGAFQGRLYASNGTTLLNTVNYSFGSCASTGIAMRSFGDLYFDTFVYTP
jgi:hypothetical protein